MKNALLFLMLYSAVVTVFLVAYFDPIRKIFGKAASALNFPQRFLLVFALSTMVVVVGIFALLMFFDFDVGQTNIGQVGDFVGGLLNPVLSFLALIAIVYSISVQEKELASTVSSLRAQEEIFKIQNFENSLFSLLAMQRNRRGEQLEVVSGKEVKVYVRLARELRTERKRIDGLGLSKRRAHAVAKESIKKITSNDSSRLLLSHVLMILGLLKSAGLSDEQYRRYIELAFSDIQAYELAVFVNNAINVKPLRRMIRKYGLSNINDQYCLSPLMNSYYKK